MFRRLSYPLLTSTIPVSVPIPIPAIVQLLSNSINRPIITTNRFNSYRQFALNTNNTGNNNNTSNDNQSESESESNSTNNNNNSNSSLARYLRYFSIFPILFAFTDSFYSIVTVSGISMEPALTNSDWLIVSKWINYDQLQRGSIVVFQSPIDPNRRLIKRLLGISNDRIVINNSMDNHYSNPFDQYPTELILPTGSMYIAGDNRLYSREDSNEIGPIPIALLVGTVPFRIWPLNKFGPIKAELPDSL